MKDRSVYIATALECIDLIQDYTSGFTLETFEKDVIVGHAVLCPTLVLPSGTVVRYGEVCG